MNTADLIPVLSEWIPAISATSLFAAVLWLLRKVISNRLTAAVRHEYDAKLEQLKSDNRIQQARIEALRSGALSSVTTRQESLHIRMTYAAVKPGID